MLSLLSVTILASQLALSAYALPFNVVLPRAVTLDQAAVAEAQQRDNTATRAFSSVPIKTSGGQCFSVDPLSGDFRENLTPVQLVACDSNSPNQKWDVITAGKHNNVPGFALVVSSLTNACLNFDPRRAAGNQVILFSCGGRADGGGSVTDSQLFSFTSGAGPFVLTPKSSNNQVCLVPNGALLDQTSCNALSPSAQQLFTIGGAAIGTPVTSPIAVSTASSTTAVVTPPPANTATSTTATVQSVSRAGGTLNPTAAAEANQRDDTATRAFTAVPIKSSTGECLAIDPNAGDFRQNLIPIALKACNAADPGQKFDVITKGKHNDQVGFALIVSSLTNGCLNFDDRRAAGDQVILFSCGGRADGEGAVTDSQLFSFGATAGTAPFVLTPKNSNNQVCLVPNGALLDQTSCNALSPSAQQLFTIGGAAIGTPASSPIIVSTVSSASSATAVVTPPPANTATSTIAAVQSVSRAGGILNPTAAAEANQRDETATRAFTGVPIKSSTGECLAIDPNAGDFRQNLIPIALKACNAADPGQKFDVITKGKHNNQVGFALIVSSLTNGCLNFDDRRAAGDQVILFSCGGRADGEGAVTDSQLFSFGATAGTAPFVLTPKNSNNQVCLVPKGALLDQTACNALSPSAQQLFTIGNVAAGTIAASPTPASTIIASSTATVRPVAAAATTKTKTTATVQSVSRAGGQLNPTAVAQAQQKDNTATRAFTGASVKSSTGKCLSINPNAGDFRQNLIPVELKACNAADPGQKFDVITKGKHNDQVGFALIVSSLTNGCLNFDPRRAAGDQVILFSCGGRADGDGKVTDSQLFSFSTSPTRTSVKIPLAPKNGNGKLCLLDQAGKLGSETCVASSATGVDVFTIG